MSLEEYTRKRDFDKTPEPVSSKKRQNSSLIFVIQKHQASHLHYDFRLEAGGVLKSWAVPKGPSMNPKDKRLAVMVEDHPIDYAKFEGEIPEGNYGAGTVEIWDSGTWEPNEKMNDIEKALNDGLLEFQLKGKILKGEFTLVEMKRSKVKNGWLLIKGHDEYAIEKDFDANDIVPLHHKE